MLPSEMMILLAFLIGKDGGKKLLERPMDVTGEYVGYLKESLVNRGLLRRRRSGYQLTGAGREAVSEFLRKHKMRAADVAQKLQQMGIEVIAEHQKKIDKLLKGAAGAR